MTSLANSWNILVYRIDVTRISPFATVLPCINDMDHGAWTRTGKKTNLYNKCDLMTMKSDTIFLPKTILIEDVD